MKKDGTITVDGKDITLNGSGKITVKAVGRHDRERLEDQPELEGDAMAEVCGADRRRGRSAC